MVNIGIYIEGEIKDQNINERFKQILQSIINQVLEIKKNNQVQFVIFSDEQINFSNSAFNISVMPCYYMYYYSGIVICFSENQVNSIIKLIKKENVLILPLFAVNNFIEIATREQLPEQNYVILDENVKNYYQRVFGIDVDIQDEEKFLLEKYNTV